MEIPRGRGLLKAKLLEEKYEAEFIRISWRVQNKNPSMGGLWIFSGTTQSVTLLRKVSNYYIFKANKSSQN